MTRTEAERLTRIEVLLEQAVTQRSEDRTAMKETIDQMARDITQIKNDLAADKADLATLKDKGAGILIVHKAGIILAMSAHKRSMATAPTIDEFRTRYPAFAAVADASVQYWLTEGFAEVGAWADDDQPRGALAYAAHKLAEGGTAATVAQGVTGFKSGTFSASISESAAGRTGFHATIYGREFLDLARRSFAGPRLAWTPTASVD